MTLYPEGYPERTFVNNGVSVKCSSYKEVSVIITEQLLVVVLLEPNWRSNFRTRWVRNHMTVKSVQSWSYNAKINFARNKHDTDKTFPKWGRSLWQLFCHFCGSSERRNKHAEKLCWENTRTIKKSPNIGLGHTYRITPYHENPGTPTFYRIIVCGPLQLMFSCSITYIAYIEENPQNTTLKIISRHVWVWISSHTLNPLYHFEAVIRIHKSSSRPSLLDMIPRLGSMPRLQLSHPDSWHNWNTCLNRPLQHAFRIHTSNLFKIAPKKGIVKIDHSRKYHNIP